MKKHNKFTKWYKNRIKVEQAQEKAQKLYFELTYEGYEVRSSLKELIFKPLKTTRYTSKQVDTYLSLVSTRAIKSASQKNGVKASSRKAKAQKSDNIVYKVQRPILQNFEYQKSQFREVIPVRKGHDNEDLARALYNNIKWAMSEHPRGFIDTALFRLFQDLEKEGLKSNVFLTQKKTSEYINSLNEDEFVKAYLKYQSRGKEEAKELSDISDRFYESGRSSEAAYEHYKNSSFEKAKQTFMGRFDGFTREDVDVLYDYFKNSIVWTQYQKVWDDSDNVDTFREIIDAVKRKGNVAADARLLLKDNDIYKKIVEKYQLKKEKTK